MEGKTEEAGLGGPDLQLVVCTFCKGNRKKSGKNPKGIQRYQCTNMWKIPTVRVPLPSMPTKHRRLDHQAKPRDLWDQQHLATVEDLEDNGDKTDKAAVEPNKQTVDLQGKNL